MLPLVNYQKKKILKSAEDKMKKLKIMSIGVTWSFWKSSVKNLLVQLLNSKFKVVNTPENINTEMWVSDIILKKVNDDFDIFVSEMWAYKIGEISLLWKIVQHKYAFITGIGNQHIALFGNQENIRRWKFEIADSVKIKQWNLYVNSDSVSNIGNDMVTYSIKDKSAKAYSEIKTKKIDHTKFVFHYKDKTRNLQTNLIGEHQILNLTGVLACCYDLWIDSYKLKKELTELKPEKSALQIKTIDSGLKIIDDSYNLSVDGLRAGIKFLDYFDEKKYLILDDIIELWKESIKTHELIGEKLSKSNLEAIFLIWKNYPKYVQKWLISNGFPSDKIFLKRWKDFIRKEITKDSIVLLEWRSSWKIF